ncbi:MAG: zinc-ribbon domain-containing protein [Chloroflexota bacterium]|nr:zinc-ribbon domain-containing protein [Chloroflexota bacterium]
MSKCPRCGASNPETNKFCGECGQLLGAVASPPRNSAPADLPAWLQAPAEPTGAQPAAVQGQASSPPADLPPWLTDIGVEDEQSTAANAAQTPDWLAQLQQSTPAPEPEAPANDLPEWLRSDTPPASAAPAARTGNDDLPAWLRDDPDLAPELLQGPAPEQAPAWLPSATSSESAPVPTADELPAWLRDDSASPSPAQPTASNEDLPAWLRQIDGAPSSTAAATPSATPSWQDDEGAAAANVAAKEEQPAPAADDLPAWLRDDAGSTPVSATGTQASSGNELPDWLSDYGTSSGQPSAPVAGKDELPAWLGGNDDLAPTPSADQAASPAAAETPTELPHWLSQTEAAESTASATTGATLPSWLIDEQPTASPETSRSGPPSWLEDEPAAAAPTGDVDVPLPDWGSELGEAPAPHAPTVTGGDALPAWLSDASSPAGNSPAKAQADGGSALPSWLIEESPTAPPAASQAPARNAPALPSWLMDESATAPAAAPETGSSDELPAWLTGDLAASSTAPDPQPPAQATDELPPWLRNDVVAEQTPPAASSDPSATHSLPAWLLDEPLPAAETTPPTTATAATSDELPSWLQATDEPLPSASAGAGPAWLGLPDAPADEARPVEAHTAEIYSVPETDALPEWLRTSDTTPDAGAAQVYEAPAETTAPAAAASKADTVELPAWLADADAAPSSSPTSAGATTELPSWLAEAENSSPNTPTAADTTTDLPSWLSDLPDQPVKTTEPSRGLPAWMEEPDQPAAADQPNAEQSALIGGLDLPAWLRDESALTPAAPAAEPAPNWLQRVDQEPEEPAAPPAVVVAPAPRQVVRTPERVASMQLLDQLKTQPAAEPAPQVPERRRSRVLTIVLALVALLIIGAVLAILLSDRLGLNFGAVPAAAPTVAGAVQLVTALPANRPVMLAYEWDAQRLAELRPLEELLVGQLAGRRDVPLMFVSTDPQGALLANERVAQLEALNDLYHLNGLGYVNLGFKAGGSLALRRFASNAAFGALFAQDANGVDLRTNDVTMESMCGARTADACSWDNVALLVVMADDVDDVRGWFEQVRSEHPDLQTMVLTPAEIAPQVQPYAAAPNVTLLAGLRDAEAYARVQGVSGERLGRQVDAVAIGNVIFAAAVVVGGIPALILGWRARRADEGGVEEQVWDR